ncbi:glycosyltransferase family 2 protein [Aequorivita sinensis]|uniref:glycosyltransferase family 2 protein n=1 Tax=Aequorivita sinensis TaxID=1382458 RepID=UPI0023015907|nr:glycosyltransferase family 2 protein [Aequorivita sinensis]
MPSSSPLVSIIIPTYNRAHLIGETLDSVLAQTYQNWECIVVDDGSTDNTDEVMAAYMAKDTRFQYHHRPKDRLPGGNAARNYGFEVSKGEYIQWFDSDDLMIDSHLEMKMNEFIADRNIDYVYCGFTTFTRSGIERSYNKSLVKNILCDYFNGNISLNTPSFVYIRKVVKSIRFDESLTRAQDLDFTFRVLKNRELKGAFVNRSLIRIRRHDKSISGEFLNNISYQDMKSELRVRKHMVQYLNLNVSVNCSLLAKKYYALTLIRALKPRYVVLYYKALFSTNTLSIKKKVHMAFYGAVILLSNRGWSKLKSIAKHT